MNGIYWIIQIILTLLFGFAGIMKATQPVEKLAPNMPWVNDYPKEMVKYIGIAEILGALGIILPYWTGIAPFLTSVAGFGLALIMVLAAVYHYRKGEKQAIWLNVVLGVMALEVAIYRFF